MFCLSQKLVNQPVMSLRTGGQVATTERPVINPNNLKIEGFYCNDKFSGQPLILLTQDIREVMEQGLAVNDHDVLVEADELVRLKEILEINFVLLGKPVVTVSKDKVGRVNDYAVETDSLFVHKLYVGQSLLKNFGGGNLSVDRSQIVEITNQRIIINDLLQTTPAHAPATA